MTPDISISIVTWNGKETVEKCLRSIFRTRPKIRFEVIVVDNASVDGTKELILQEFPDVLLIQNEENIGYGPAHNRAYRISQGRHLLVLNNDITITEGALEGLVHYMDEHPNVGLVGGRLQNPDGTFQSSANRRFPTLLGVFLEQIFFLTSLRIFLIQKTFGARFSRLRWNLEMPQSVAWVGGACMLIRREVMERVGLFDDHFFFYYEDSDLCLRIKKSGWDVVYDPRYCFVHEWGTTTRRHVGKFMMESRKSILYYFRKHNGMFGFLVAKYSLLTGLAWRCFLLSLMSIFRRKEEKRLRFFQEMILFFSKMGDPLGGLRRE